MSNVQQDGNIEHVGFVGDLHITQQQSDALARYYTELVRPKGLLRMLRAEDFSQCALAIRDALSILGLRFEPMATEAEGYYLAGPAAPQGATNAVAE